MLLVLKACQACKDTTIARVEVKQYVPGAYFCILILMAGFSNHGFWNDDALNNLYVCLRAATEAEIRKVENAVKIQYQKCLHSCQV